MMKTIFIVNPMAGQGGKIRQITDAIRDALEQTSKEGEIYLTQGVGDATEYVKQYCDSYGPARFIACGGDGTLGEVLNGIMGCPDAEIGVVPMGTGNDFCRNFGDELDFRNVTLQLLGKSFPCDVIRYETESEGKRREGFCMNMFNIGFDCNVADMTAEMKKKPLVSGSMAYLLSIFKGLIQKKTTRLEIALDGEVVYKGELLLTSVANGCYCGGGIKSNPMASVRDGMLNINIIRNISRLRFISLLPHYMKGTHLNLPGIEKVITTKACKKMTMIPQDGAIRLCVDGEIVDGGKTEFEVIPSAVKFVVPAVQGAVQTEKEVALA